MKILKVLLFLILVGLILICGTLAYVWAKRVPLLEKVANQASYELFEGSLRLKDVQISASGKIELINLTGTMKMDDRRVQIQIEKLETSQSIITSILNQRSELRLTHFSPIPQNGNPISGILHLNWGQLGSAEIHSDFSHVDIEDYAWIDPVNLNGLRGFVSGKLKFSIDSNEKINFSASFFSDEKGGEVPARFLEFALPYLPKAQNTKDLVTKISKQKSIPFIRGLLKAETPEPGKIQARIEMLFPEQNINLNLNLTILVDEENAFVRAFKLLALFKIQPKYTPEV